MKTLRDTYSIEEMSDKEIMEAVLGRNSVYLRGWGRSSCKTDHRGCRTFAEPDQPSYQQLLQQVNDANTRLDEVVKILCENNLMPKTSSTNRASDTGAHSENLE